MKYDVHVIKPRKGDEDRDVFMTTLERGQKGTRLCQALVAA
jgi:hypothetical protein